MCLTLYLLFAVVRIALFCNFSNLQNKKGVHELQYMSLQNPFQSTRNSDGTRCFGWNLLDMWSPAEVSIDCKAKEVTLCHSFNWLWIYCQLQGLKNLHCADDNGKAWILFSYIKEHLVYIKPFQNAFNLIVDILWYFFHLHVFGRCWVAKQTQMTYQNLYYLHII